MDIINKIKATYPNVHIEVAYDGWVWIFSNGDLVATYNYDSGELVKIA